MGFNLNFILLLFMGGIITCGFVPIENELNSVFKMLAMTLGLLISTPFLIIVNVDVEGDTMEGDREFIIFQAVLLGFLEVLREEAFDNFSNSSILDLCVASLALYCNLAVGELEIISSR